MNELTAAGVLALALLGDALLGDPPNRFHVVAWMGKYLAWARRHVTATGNGTRLMLGLAVVACGVMVVAAIGVLIQRVCRECNLWVAMLIQAGVLKCTFSVRSLSAAANSVRDALQADDLATARQQVAYHLVSRNVEALSASQLSAATIESVAENTSDSVIAPLFYFAIAGLPGALVYRFVNTCDAMLGYRTDELEWFGKPAARLDDLLNLVPSRITAMLMLLTYGISVGRFRAATAIWKQDHKLTASPNAGHPMSAAAGVLGVALEKESHYLLGSGQALPNCESINQSVRLLWITSIAAFLLIIAMLILVGVE